MSKDGTRPGSLRISGTGLPGGTEIELDGHDITPALRGITVRLDAEERPTATLDVRVREVPTELEGVQVWIAPQARELLVRLGWTPPEGETP